MAMRSSPAATRCCGPCAQELVSKWIIRLPKKKKARGHNFRRDGSSNREPAARSGSNVGWERAFVPKGPGEKNGSRRSLEYFAARGVGNARVVHDLHRGFMENL